MNKAEEDVTKFLGSNTESKDKIMKTTVEELQKLKGVIKTHKQALDKAQLEQKRLVLLKVHGMVDAVSDSGHHPEHHQWLQGHNCCCS